MWRWFHGGWHRSAEEGKEEDIKNEGCGGKLKKERLVLHAADVHAVSPSFFDRGRFTVWAPCFCPSSHLFFKCFAIRNGGQTKQLNLPPPPPHLSFINQTSAVCQWRTQVVKCVSRTCTKTHKSMQLTTDKCLGVFHISSALKNEEKEKAPELSLCLSMCQRRKERKKKKLVRRMTWKRLPPPCHS